MLHTEVLKKYKEMFELDEDSVDVWHANGYNSIRIRFKDKREIVFSFNNEKQWRLETIKCFIDSMNKK